MVRFAFPRTIFMILHSTLPPQQKQVHVIILMAKVMSGHIVEFRTASAEVWASRSASGGFVQSADVSPSIMIMFSEIPPMSIFWACKSFGHVQNREHCEIEEK